MPPKSKFSKARPQVLKNYAPPQTPLHILYHDDDLLVLSKPSGLLSVPGREAHLNDSLQMRVLREYPEALLVHRLDRGTSGVFIMAMNKNAQRNLGLQFERRKTEKTYIACVWGRPKEDEGFIDLPLRCDWERRPIQMVCHEHGKPSQTKWRVLNTEADNHDNIISRLELKPITGRSHQLRVHLSEIGYPILGDSFYAHETAFKLADRLQLHAESLTVYHPNSGEPITFKDDVPF